MWHVAQLRSAPLKLCSSLVIVSAMLFPVSPSAGALEVKWPHSPTLFVRCDPESPEPPKKVEVSSPILIAKSGPYRAWVQVTSTPHGITCFNITNLWLQAGHHEHYLAYTDAPTDPYFSGTGMNLVDWSADGELLLTELWQWDTQPNDGGVDRHILVFQPATGAKYEINFGALIADQKDKDCYIRFELLGFTAQRWVALKADVSTFYDVDETPADKPVQKICKAQSQVWAVDPFTQRWELLPDDFQAHRNSLIEKRAVKNVHPR